MSDSGIAVQMKLKASFLLKHRLEHGLYQKDVAAILGVSIATYSQWERLYRVPSEPEVIQKMEDYYKTPIEQIFPDKLKEFVKSDNDRSKTFFDVNVRLPGVDLKSLPDSSDFRENLNNKELPDAIEALLSDKDGYAILTDREATCIRLHYGLKPYDKEHTYKEIGDKFSVSHTRVAQIVAKALRKLMHPAKSRSLKEFMYPDENWHVIERETK